MAERALVNVEIVKKGDGTGTYDGGGRGEVRVRTTKGDLVWVPEKDVIARKLEESTRRSALDKLAAEAQAMGEYE